MDIKSSNKKGQDRYFVSLVLSVITPRLRKYLICCLVILGLNCTFGCANIIVTLLPEQDMLMMKARYGELMHHMERNVEIPETAKSYDLYCLCMSYSKVKNYNKLFSCLDYLERRVEKGDHYGPMSWDFRPAASIYRAEALIDLGDYPKAISAAKKACELSDAIESKYFITTEDLSSKLGFKIPSLAALGLAYALNGDRQQAERAAA